MEKKSNFRQIVITVGLVLAGLYIGFILPDRKSKDVEVAVENQEQTTQPLQGMDAARQVASALEINMEEFETCVANPDMAEKVQSQQDLGEKAGVSGTPGSYLYDTTTKKAIQLGGAVPLETMKSELSKLKAGEGTSIDIAPINEEDFVKGNADARYALIEWSDYECPYCGRFQEAATQLVAGDTDVKWVYRQFPLDSIHPNTRDKSIAALCVGQIGGNDSFWEFSDRLLLQ